MVLHIRMSIIDLTGKPNIEELLKEANVLSEKIPLIENEIGYFDEYYLTSDNKFVKVFRQEFRNDPHMTLEAELSTSL